MGALAIRTRHWRFFPYRVNCAWALDPVWAEPRSTAAGLGSLAEKGKNGFLRPDPKATRPRSPFPRCSPRCRAWPTIPTCSWCARPYGCQARCQESRRRGEGQPRIAPIARIRERDRQGSAPDPARLLVLSVPSVPSVAVPFPCAASAARRAEAPRQSESEKPLTNRNETPVVGI